MNNKKYYSHEEEISGQISFDEALHRIKEDYQAEYDPDRPNFNAWDQLLACEAVTHSTPMLPLYEEVTDNKNRNENENANISGMISDSCKQEAIFELTQHKQKVIKELTLCNFLTPPIKIALLLEEFFKEWRSKQGHWLFVAQHWTPRAIVRTINRLTKLHIDGRITIRNPSAYFTKLIKFRKQRRIQPLSVIAVNTNF